MTTHKPPQKLNSRTPFLSQYKGISPNFMIVGAMKCGTSYVAEVLSEHPDVCFSRLKEPQFFMTRFRNSTSDLGPSFYASQFTHFSGEHAIGEGSALYFSDPDSASLIHDAFGKIRIIICLRDPILRTISHYLHIQRFGYLPPSLCILLEQDSYFSQEIKITNKYGTNTKRFFDIMGDGNVLIVLQENLHSNPLAEFSRIANFLEIDLSTMGRLNRTVNSARAPRSIVAMQFLDFIRTATHRQRHILQASFPNTYRNARSVIMSALFRDSSLSPLEILSEPAQNKMRQDLDVEIALLESLTGLELSHWKAG